MAKNSQIQEFISRWTGHGDEKQETQKFWFELLQAMGYQSPSDLLQFEKRVKLDGSTRFIDVYIPQTRVIVEQKSLGIDLSKAEQQSGGDLLTPYNQARRYDNNLPVGEKARWIVCCNFERFEIHDMEKPLAEPEVVLLKDLEKSIQGFSFLTDIKVQAVRREEEISFKAGKLVGELYDMILPQYADPSNPDTLKSLNQLCVRLVFCLYAEDTGLFGEKDKFYKYLKAFNPGQFRKALIELFKVFDTPYEERDRYMEPELASFPYIKGGIFTEDIEIPLFTEQIIDVLLNKASLEVDWSDISPTIFGAVFESTLNPATRRSGGMHYTSVENIHKVIDPLFLDDLRAEFEQAVNIPVKAKRNKALTDFQDKLAGLKFLDPACGSGNFLTETYLSLRRLENETLQALGIEGMLYFGEEFSPIKVKIDQFYGIEINDFAVSVARIALWIAESQTMKETEHIVQRPIEYFPLRENPNIVEGNALRIDWNEVVPKEELNYIMGNPPFVGESLRTKEQSEDMAALFGVGSPETKLDYVLCWYKKAIGFIDDKKIHSAFVSTNSICQGESVPAFWKSFKRSGFDIDFAYRSFKWENEASDAASVYCVIVGFSRSLCSLKHIFFQDRVVEANNINGYLCDAPDVWLESRSSKCVHGMPKITKGSEPTDDGQLFLTKSEKDGLIASYPELAEYIQPFVGAKEYLECKTGEYSRFCFWFEGKPLGKVAYIPELRKRFQHIKEKRQSSSADRVRNKADYPYLFCQSRQPKTDYLIIPRHTTSSRSYIPMAYMSCNVICGDSNSMIPNTTLFMFGVLESATHMSWMKTVCGRLGMGYRYSPLVYNNFPWPAPSEVQKAKIEKTAQAILDARELYKDCSFADMYGEKMYLFSDLVKAHQANDRAVMEAYGFDPAMTEEQIVAELLKMYQKLVA